MSSRIFGLSFSRTALLVCATTSLVIGGCQAADGADSEALVADEEVVGASEQALRTPGSLAKYFHTSGSQAVTLEEEYSSWSAKWHTIMQAGVDNQLFFYNRLDGTAKTFLLSSTGVLTLQQQTSLPTGTDFWVRGNFTGTSAKELASYSRQSGIVNVYEVSSTGVMTFKLTQAVGLRYSLGFAGYWGNGSFDDLVLYDKADGKAKYFASNGLNLFSNVKTVTWQKIWDHIVPGRFNTDSLSDLFFYNQDSGEFKLYTMDSTRNGTLTDSGASLPDSAVPPVAPIVPYATFIKGEFGGSAQTDDLLFYDQRAGIARFFLSSTSATLSEGARHTGWQKKWTHLVPVKQSGTSTTDFLLYSNFYDVDVVAVRLSDTIFGTNQAPLTQAQFQRWIDKANETYGAAGVNFVWNGTINELADPALNAYQCDENDSDGLKYVANALAVQYGAPEKVVVFVRGNDPGDNSGDGCGSPLQKYVIMPGFTQTAATYRTRSGLTTDSFGTPIGTDIQTQNNIKLFPHEVGHYLGLDHVYKSSTNPPNIYGFDQDLTACCSFTNVYDTPPTPPVSQWGVANADICDDSVEVIVSLQSGTADLNPERHNVMLNSANCDLTYRLSPGQIDAVRTNLFGNRVELTQ